MNEVNAIDKPSLERLVLAVREEVREVDTPWSRVRRSMRLDARLHWVVFGLAIALALLALWDGVMLWLSYMYPGNVLDQTWVDFLTLPGERASSIKGVLASPEYLPRLASRRFAEFALMVLLVVGAARRDVGGRALTIGIAMVPLRGLYWWIVPFVDENGVGHLPDVFGHLSAYGDRPLWWIVSHMGTSVLEMTLATCIVVFGLRLSLRHDADGFDPIRFRWPLFLSAVLFTHAAALHVQQTFEWCARLNGHSLASPAIMFDFMALNVAPMLLCGATLLGIVYMRTWSLLSGVLAAMTALLVPRLLPLFSYLYVEQGALLPDFASWSILLALAPLAWAFIDALRSGPGVDEPTPTP